MSEKHNHKGTNEGHAPLAGVMHRRHKWDTPKHPISATCVKCGCKRIAEKYSTGMGWIYIEQEKITELTSAPACT